MPKHPNMGRKGVHSGLKRASNGALCLMELNASGGVLGLAPESVRLRGSRQLLFSALSRQVLTARR